MNFAEMLCYADIDELGKIAKNYACECSLHSKNELIQSIISTVNKKDTFEKYVNNLQLEDIRFLNSILFDRRNSFSMEDLVARARQTLFSKEEGERTDPRELINKFKHSGWLFKGYSQQTRYLLQVPEDLKRRFSKVLTKRFLQEMLSIMEPSVYRDEQKLIINDMLLFLRYVYHQEVQLTAEGFMYKRFLLQILTQLDVQEEPPREVWRFGYGRRFKEYPNRFSIIYDFCYYEGYIEENNGVLSLTGKGKVTVKETQNLDISQVYKLWIKLYKNPITNLTSIVHWIKVLAAEWVSVDSLRNVLIPLIKPFYYDTAASIFEQRIVQMMMHLGLLKIGNHEQYGTVVQISKLGISIIEGTYVAEEERIELDTSEIEFPE